MVTVICEKTGIEFEAATKRTKNHPTIMAFLSEANRYGWYADALEAIKRGRASGFNTLEQFVNALHTAEEQYKLRTNAAYAAESQRKREEDEARRQRFIFNKLLRDHGYDWIDLGYPADEEIDNSFTGHLPEHDWNLKAPDGSFVSLRTAMETLAAEDVKFAKEWLAR